MANNRVLGRELLKKKLAALPKAVKSEVQAELNIAAGEVVAAQKALAAPNVDSGSLQMSIRFTPFSRGGIGVIFEAGGPLTTREVREGSGVDYDYALANELGTQDMLAQPFFYSGFRRKRASIRRRASKGLRKAVARGAGVK